MGDEGRNNIIDNQNIKHSNCNNNSNYNTLYLHLQLKERDFNNGN